MSSWRPTLRTWFSLWLLIALFLSMAATLELGSQRTVLHFLQGRQSELCAAASNAYEQGGPERLATILETIKALSGIHLLLVDTNGRDLATKQDLKVSLLEGRRRRLLLFDSSPPLALDAPLGRACLLSPGSMELQRPMSALLVGLPFVCLVCLSIVLYVSFRSRRLEAALAKFGSGELAYRAEIGGHDPLGRVADRFNEMAERIHSLVNANQALCADISHELRSPLARLRLAAQMAREEMPGALDRVESEAERLDELVAELLDVARAEADSNSLQRVRLHLRHFLDEIVADCEIEAASKGCEIQIHSDSSLRVEADPELLRRAIENVLRNAIRHSPPYTSESVEVRQTGGMALIGIRDSGPGVPPAALHRIFDPFYRVEPERNQSTGGTGLGLSIARRAVTVHRGSICASNCLPGLLVEIRIPQLHSPTTGTD